jgi:hypothetical protein
MGIDQGRGLITKELKKIKRDHVMANGTIQNLITGIKTRYKSGDKRVGNYERSEETLSRLRNLHSFRKVYAKGKI